MKQLTSAALAFGLLVPALALADDGPKLAKKGVQPPAAQPAATHSAKTLKSKTPWPEALKHRNARYAVLTRCFDAKGDEHEAFVLNYELKRMDDHLGDHEAARIYRQYAKGLTHVIHAHLARDTDPMGDAYQQTLASMSLSRRYADLRRDRDLTGDKLELAQWKRDRLNWGDRPVVIADDDPDPKGQQIGEHYLVQRESAEQESQSARDERQDEKDQERSFNAEDDRSLERRMERQSERQLDKESEKTAEDTLDNQDRQTERESERQLDQETEKAIESSADSATGIDK